MATLTYLNVATNQTYDSDAWDYVTGTEVLQAITDSATELGISAGAIAGAMAEEQMSYDFLQESVDDYARYGALTEEQINELENDPPMNFFTQAWFAGLNIVKSPEGERSQAEWVAEWEAISGGLGSNYGAIQDRLDHWNITSNSRYGR